MQRIVGGASWCLVAFVVIASLGGVLAHSAWASGTPEAAQSRSLRDPGGHHYHGRHGGEHYHRGHNPGGPHGGSHHAKWPQATLQAQAQAEVPQDMVRIVLATQLSDSSQQAVAKALTAAINTAMERARGQSDGVTVSSGNFRVWPMNDKDGNISNWRGSGEIVLESDDFGDGIRVGVAAFGRDSHCVCGLCYRRKPGPAKNNYLRRAARFVTERKP